MLFASDFPSSSRAVPGRPLTARNVLIGSDKRWSDGARFEAQASFRESFSLLFLTVASTPSSGYAFNVDVLSSTSNSPAGTMSSSCSLRIASPNVVNTFIAAMIFDLLRFANIALTLLIPEIGFDAKAFPILSASAAITWPLLTIARATTTLKPAVDPSNTVFVNACDKPATTCPPMPPAPSSFATCAPRKNAVTPTFNALPNGNTVPRRPRSR